MTFILLLQNTKVSQTSECKAGLLDLFVKKYNHLNLFKDSFSLTK